MAKLPKINYGNHRKFLREFLKYLEFFGATFEPETLERRSRALKFVLYPRIQKHFEPQNRLIGSADDAIKRTVKLTPVMTSLTKNPKSKTKNFFFNSKLQRVFRGFEQLSSSICCRIIAGQNLV